VPIFVMISGALMLDEAYISTWNKTCRHIRKLLLFFMFWSMAYCLVFEIGEPLLSGEPLNPYNIASMLITGYNHMWYIYMTIGLYLILPLLRAWVTKENKRQVEYFLVLALIFSFFLPQLFQIGEKFIPWLDIPRKVIETINIQYVGGYTAYFLLGWYLHNFPPKKYRLLLIMGTVSWLVIFLGSHALSVLRNWPTLLYDYISVPVFFYSVMIFCIIKHRCETKKQSCGYKPNKMIQFLAANSLGIYAMHSAVITVIMYVFETIDFNIAILAIPMLFIASGGLSMLVSAIFKKIPLLREVV
jgi:surface polysaccharide O-acyltransferase-like enzyme